VRPWPSHGQASVKLAEDWRDLRRGKPNPVRFGWYGDNENDPLPSTLYGRRYTQGRVTARTPAIVLVHGIASSTDNWDFSPSWSVARALAAAG
jgi:pimeloyl-ACP methyl ester carboxylesterase